jgi:serine/threonine protein kinase
MILSMEMKVCPVCEGFTARAHQRCGHCDVPLVARSALAWPVREREREGGNPWVGLWVGGKYRITGILGKGGMGTVYRARHELTLAQIALKILNPGLDRKPAYRAGLIQEARKAAGIRGDHVARILDAGETGDGGVYIAMELVRGVTLHDLVLAEGHLPFPKVLELIRQIALGLDEAHEAGLVHRDLASRNVMVSPMTSGVRVRILDFGIARMVDEAEGGIRGWVNPPYTAPEILRGEEGDIRSDLFSLGVIAIEALTGTVPFRGRTVQERIERCRDLEPSDWPMPHSAPGRFLRLLRRLLDRDPGRRPRSAREVIDELRKIQKSRGRLLKAAAVLVFFSGIGVTLFKAGRAAPPYLENFPDAALVLRERSEEGFSKLQTLRAEDLRTLRFEAGGFAAENLLLEVFQDPKGEDKLRLPAGGKLQGQSLILDQSSPGWRQVYKLLEQAQAPVHLAFRLKGRNRSFRPLGFAKVQLDSSPPRIAHLHASTSGQTIGPLRIDTSLLLSVDDDSAVAETSLELLEADGTPLARLAVNAPLDALGNLRIPIGRRLREKRVPDRQGRVTLGILVRDRVGRETRQNLVFESLDLSIPKIIQVSAPDGSRDLAVTGGWAEARLRFAQTSEEASRLRVQIRQEGDEGAWKAIRTQVIEARPESLKIRFNPPSSKGEKSVFLLEFSVLDKAGNRSQGFRAELRFRNLDLHPEMQIGGGGASRLFPTERHVFYDDKPLVIHYRCNKAYYPTLLPFSGPKGERPVVETLGTGAGVLDLKVLPTRETRTFGLMISHKLRIHTDDGSPLLRQSGRSYEIHLTCLPQPPFCRIPSKALNENNWTPTLMALGILEGRRDQFVLGANLRILAPTEGGMKIRVGLLRGGELEPLSNFQSPAFLPGRTPIPISEGRNLIVLEGTDLLGRKLQVRTLSGKRIPNFRIKGHSLCPIARFRHDATPPVPLETPVEYGRTLRIRLEEDKDFRRGTAPVLSLNDGGLPVRGKVLTSGTQFFLEFRLPFARFAAISHLGGVGRADFGKLSPFSVSARVTTMGGENGVELPFRPIQSLLTSVLLRNLGAKLPKGFPVFRLVPFLRPDPSEGFDFGPPTGPSKGSVVLAKRLRIVGLDNFFLGSAEVSRKAYLLFLEDLGRLSTLTRKDLAKALVHPEDPLGANRLLRINLEPETKIFGKSFEMITKDGPERPVSGVTFFQAQCFVRWLGWRGFGKPSLLRLPFGAEMEWAALGHFSQGGRNRWNAIPLSSAKNFYRRLGRTRRIAFSGGRPLPSLWPLLPSELANLGDVSRGFGGGRVSGLDFGLREWVEDIALVEGDDSYLFLREKVSNHPSHVAFVRDRWGGKGEDLPESARASFKLGVLRGYSLMEDALGFGTSFGLPPHLDTLGGVRRMVYLPKAGREQGEEEEFPLVGVSGFRVAGTKEFLRLVREERR